MRLVLIEGLSALKYLGEVVAKTIEHSIPEVDERTLERVIQCKDDHILVLSEVGEVTDVSCDRSVVAVGEIANYVEKLLDVLIGEGLIPEISKSDVRTSIDLNGKARVFGNGDDASAIVVDHERASIFS